MTAGPLPSREEAVNIIRESRARLTQLIDGLSDSQLETPETLEGASWSVKNLMGHLASWEERGLRLLDTGGDSPQPSYPPTDEFNAAEVARKAEWPLSRIQQEAVETHNRLIDAIENMSDEAWATNVPVPGRGDHPLGFVVGMTLAGDEHGLFAHDLAHLADVDAYVRIVSKPQ